jgi:hypothetical protein
MHYSELSPPQLQRLLALSIMGAAMIFILGYYVGKISQSEEVAERVRTGAFADYLYCELLEQQREMKK